MLFDHALVMSSAENVWLDQWTDRRRQGEEGQGGDGRGDESGRLLSPFFSPTMDLAKRAGQGFELNNPR